MSKMRPKTLSPFNSPLETAVRALVVLVSHYPISMDLQRLSTLDYLLVHSGDLNGPASLHPPLPYRTGEILVRRRIVQEGLYLLVSKGVVAIEQTSDGFVYHVTELAQPLLELFTSDYFSDLKDRADWIAEQFSAMPSEELQETVQNIFSLHTTEFMTAPIREIA
jgi:hypothetical protein